jgi:hypothetical protein
MKSQADLSKNLDFPIVLLLPRQQEKSRGGNRLIHYRLPLAPAEVD